MTTVSETFNNPLSYDVVDDQLIDQSWIDEVLSSLLYTVRQAEPQLTNKSGAGVIAGDLVKVDMANDSSFTTTTTASQSAVFGVAMETIANNATGRVRLIGKVTINITGTVTRGDYLESSTSAKLAKSAGTGKTSATFAIALTTASGGTCVAIVLPSTSSGDTIQRGNAGSLTTGSGTVSLARISSSAITFPVAYSSAPVVCVGGTTTNSSCFHGAYNVTTTGFTMYLVSESTSTAFANNTWLAISA